ncbi:MAG: peptide chain release factor aRF-1 [Candidatus Micrarchaeia archaeon]
MAADKKKRELMKLLNKLGKIRGTGTELISLYVPAGYPLTEVVNKLRSEHGQAGNIKSKTTRTNVQDAIDKIINYLKFFKKTPDKGLAIFCGNISKDPGKTDIQLFSIEPPLPIQVSIYRCDSEFVLEPLAEQGKVKEKYGLVTIDGKEATIGVLEGNVTKILKRLTTTGPSKSTKGGSSAARYQRFVEELVEDYYRRVGDAMNETLLPSGIKKVIVGGPGPVKENFLKMKPFNYQFQILAVLDTGYVDDYGIQELARKAVDLISEEKAKKQRQLLEKFFSEVAKGGLAVYGPKETIEAMNSGKLGTLLLSEGLNITRLIVECDSGQEELFIDGEIEEKEEKELRCSDGSKIKNIVSKEELFDEAYEKAEKHGIEVELIPEDSPEGKQFLAGFKGIGGLLRYK